MYFTYPSGKSHWKQRQNKTWKVIWWAFRLTFKISLPPAEPVGNRARLPIGVRNNTDSVSWTRLLPKPVREVREVEKFKFRSQLSPFRLLPDGWFAISASSVLHIGVVTLVYMLIGPSWYCLPPQKMMIGPYIQWWTENNPDQSCLRCICENFQT